LEDYSMIKIIGKGTYAKVILVRKNSDNKLYAIKVLKKHLVEQKKQEFHTKTERNILTTLQHPFIVKCYQAFQNNYKLFFVLEYCPGGELFNLLIKYKRFNEE